MTLGEKLQLCRKKKGLSQEDVAGLLNVSVKEIDNWERDNVIPTQDKLKEISNSLDVSLEWLTKDVNENKQQSIEEIETSNKEPDTNIDEKEKPKEKGVSYAAIVGWTIVGIVLGPLSVGGSIWNATQDSLICLFALLMYGYTIPLGIVFLHKVKYAKQKSDTIAIGVLTIIFLNAIAGILILCLRDWQFPLSIKEPKVKKEKSIKEIKEEEKPEVIIEKEETEEPVALEEASEVEEKKKKEITPEVRRKRRRILAGILIFVTIILIVFAVLIPVVFIPLANPK